MISVDRPTDSALLKLLERHPEVGLSENSGRPGSLVFSIGDRTREVSAGDPSIEESGLLELIDNNPLVCADVVSVPGPAATLALIALGPLIRAGMLVERPMMQFSSEFSGEDVDGFLESAGWSAGIDVTGGDEDLGTVLAANVMALIRTPDDWSDIDELYDECFGRSFYVHDRPEGEWDTKLVEGRPFAVYRLRSTPGEENSLLTIQVMADKDGKCGAAQMLHAMNVMCGFEECEGLPV